MPPATLRLPIEGAVSNEVMLMPDFSPAHVALVVFKDSTVEAFSYVLEDSPGTLVIVSPDLLYASIRPFLLAQKDSDAAKAFDKLRQAFGDSVKLDERGRLRVAILRVDILSRRKSTSL